MDDRDLLKLLDLQNLTPAQLRERDPALAQEVEVILRQGMRQRVLDAIDPALEEARRRIAAIDVSRTPLSEIRQVLGVAVAERPAPVVRPAAAAATVVLDAIARTPAVDETAAVKRNPEVDRLLRKAQLIRIGALARVDSGVIDKIAGDVGRPDAITDSALSKIVAEGKLTEAQAAAIGAAATIYELADEDPKIAEVIRAAARENVHGTDWTRRLAAMRSEQWLDLIREQQVDLPKETTAAELAGKLEERFSALHPDAALLAQLPKADAAAVQQRVGYLEPLLSRDPKALDRDFAELDVSGLTAPARKQAEAAHAELKQLVRAFPGLRLDEIFGKAGLSPADKAAAVARRVSFVDQIHQRVGDGELLSLDFSPESSDLAKLRLGELGATTEEQTLVVAALKAYQRVFTLTNDVAEAKRLIAEGYPSAVAIGRQSLEEFRARTKAGAAEAYWRDARAMLIDATATVGSIIDIVAGVFDDLRVGNVRPGARDYLRKLDGFETLFGNLAYCTCEHCQSVLSPAAYFVDLMHFVEEQIGPQFSGHPNHPLRLRERRPDLWTLELTCENTNKRIATLDIVNEILENFIAARRGFAGSLADRAAVGDLVYRQTLRDTVNSFQQPFHLPLARIGRYLEKMQSARVDVARLVGASAPTIAAAELNLSPQTWDLVTQQELGTVALNRLYHLTFAAQGAGFAPFDAQDLVQAMGIDRNQLDDLIATTFVRAGGANVTVTAEKSSADSVQNDVERVRGLTADALDRMHRFTRLWRHVPWSMLELDRVLTAIDEATLGAAGVQRVAEARAVHRRFSTTADDTAALAGPIPRTPDSASFFDRLFNPPDIAQADRLPLAARRFVHPEFRANTAVPADSILPRLLAGLGLDLAGLASLARGLAPHLASQAGILAPDAADEDDRDFLLSHENLSLLYRHARVARLLRLTIDDLLLLIKIGGVGGGRLATTADVLDLIDLAQWRRDNGYSMDDLAVATGEPPRDATRFVDPVATADSMVAGAAAALSFGSTVFSVAIGVTEDASRELLENNVAVVERTVEGRWRLLPGLDLDAAAIVVPASATIPVPPSGSRLATADEVRGVLRAYEPSAVIARAVGTAFGFDAPKVEALAALAGVSLQANALALALRGEGPIDALRDAVAALGPLAVAFRPKEWDAAGIEFARAAPQRFAVVPPAVTIAGLRAISVYTLLAKRQLGTGDEAKPIDAADIRAALEAFEPAGPGFPTAVNEALGRVIGVSPGLVAAMRGRVALPAVAAPALEALDRAARLASALGIDGESFAALASNDYAALDRGADALQSAFGARYPDGEQRATQLDILAEPLREKKRDGLVAWLVHSLAPRLFRKPSDLYQHFLIDAEAGGCSTTSRVVAAISSVQLYIHRIILNLEQTSPDAADPLALRMPDAGAAEWTWRKNYRVWEANRKVFLWPENYIEPDLRDDKTPLFKELESELLQTAISDQDVLDSYTKYLKGFEELATLSIAGAYHDARKDRGRTVADVLHLFGATSADPPVYYYRTCEHLIASAHDTKKTAVWTPWQKLDVQITGRRVGPIVHRGRLYLFWADFKTRSFNTVQAGASEFAGYRHTMSIKYTMLRPDGSWTAPQMLAMPVDTTAPSYWPFGPSAGVIQDVKTGDNVELDATRPHPEPLDDYTLRGVNWDALYLDPNDEEFAPLLNITGRNYQLYAYVDLFRNSVEAPHTVRDLPGSELGFPILCARGSGSGRELFYGHPTFWYPNQNAYGDLALDERRIEIFNAEYNTEPLREGLYQQLLAIVGEVGLMSVAGAIEDAILQSDADVLLLQGSVTTADTYVLRRIGTTLADDVAFQLFVGGVDGLLDIQTQLGLQEADIPITILNRIEDRSNAGLLDFKGPYGVYYREIFFHIPFLIANALNSRGNYAAAQRWYHYIFDPTATEVINVPAGTPPEEKARRLLDRVWRYREFRNLDLARLRDILTDEEALAVYRKDPFNPHAIARLRISAYQKSIVMKYVDNLLDWADFLFTQFTMESVNEALMLYIMAQDILGPRPARLGDCGEGKISPKTYENIRDEIGAGEEILIEVESWLVGKRAKKKAAPSRGRFAVDRSAVTRVRKMAPLGLRGAGPAKGATMVNALSGVAGGTAVAAMASPMTMAPAPLATRPLREPVVKIDAAEEPQMFRGLSWKETRTGGWSPPLGAAASAPKEATLVRIGDHHGRYNVSDWIGTFGWSLVRQVSPVFCIPVNTDLLEYWNRVEDRLWKIRNCRDITGAKRELALFAPPIDPRLLVRMRAAGLTLEDVVGATAGDLPPYRFLFLIDRAKAFASTLSSFGAALLSAIEKKDAEEMGRLRVIHQQNLSRMTTQLRRWDIETAQEALTIAQRQKEAAEYRRDYFEGLVNQYRSGLESAEAIIRHIVSGIHVGESVLDLLSAIFAALPQVGSPFAMKYGGVELNTTIRRFGNAAHAVAEGLQAAAGSIGLEANFQRRAEGWRHQKEVAAHDIRQIDRQIVAAEIRLEIANRGLELHEKSIEQMDEILELMDGKFSSFGFYTFMSTELRRIHRSAYQNALALARLAEQAFRFERGDETLPGLEPTYWDATHSGLLSGEQLLIDLQNLERRYLETNYRSLEVDQAFALSQIAPDALIELRQNGECTFEIGELFFDLFYPGHFKRRIRAVRLTMPSITGPYVNVSATLTLDRSWIRTTATIGDALTEVPPRRSVSVATSTAQNDAGVFELSFRDERYMPFEGAGAISRWVLTLPKTFRQFDYETITDVIMSISYTAEQDGALRDRVETDNAALDQSIRKLLAETGAARVFSLRQDFSSAFNRLLHSPAATDVPLEITRRQFPVFLGDRPIAVTRAMLLLRTAAGVAPDGFALSVDGAALNAFAPDATLGNLAARPLPAAFGNNLIGSHTFRLDAAGSFAPAAPVPGDTSPLDSDQLLDLLVYIEYTVP